MRSVYVMHRIMLPDGSHRQSRTLQYARVIGYFSMATAGVMIILSQVLETMTANALAGFLSVGGLLAALGALFMRWVGEFLGLPLAAAGLISLGLITWDLSRGSGAPYLSLANLSLLIGYGFLLLGRWRTVWAIYRIATLPSKRGNPEGKGRGGP